MSLSKTALVLFALTVFSIPLFAQFTPAGSGGRFGDANPVTGEDPMRTAVNLSGSVRTLDNHPVDNARVELREVGTGSLIGSIYTSANGAFEFRDVPRGNYELSASLGVVDSRERIELRFGDNNVVLRLVDTRKDSAGGGTTVSVANLKVPGKAKSAYHKAEELVSKGRIDDARKEIDKALQIYSTYGAAYTLLGIIALDQHDAQTALANLDKAIQYDPDSPTSYLVMGATFNTLGRFDDALRSLNSASRLAPQSWQAYFEMSKAYLGKSDFQQALQLVTKAEGMGGSAYPPIHLVKAHALLGAKDYNKAVAELELYVARDPQSANAAAARNEIDQVKAFTAKQ